MSALFMDNSETNDLYLVLGRPLRSSELKLVIYQKNAYMASKIQKHLS